MMAVFLQRQAQHGVLRFSLAAPSWEVILRSQQKHFEGF